MRFSIVWIFLIFRPYSLSGFKILITYFIKYVPVLLSAGHQEYPEYCNSFDLGSRSSVGCAIKESVINLNEHFHENQSFEV